MHESKSILDLSQEWRSSLFWGSEIKERDAGLSVTPVSHNCALFCTVPVVPELVEPLSQCLSQHAITFISKPPLSFSMSRRVSAVRSTPPLFSTHLFPILITLAVLRSLYPISFLNLASSFSSKTLLSSLSRVFLTDKFTKHLVLFLLSCHY